MPVHLSGCSIDALRCSGSTLRSKPAVGAWHAAWAAAIAGLAARADRRLSWRRSGCVTLQRRAAALAGEKVQQQMMQLIAAALQASATQSAFAALQQFHHHRQGHLLTGPGADGGLSEGAL